MTVPDSSGMAATLVSSPTALASASRIAPHAGRSPVSVAAGANALDDLLAKIAALGEVQGAGLSGFLGKLFIADVGAVEG